jgi:hypothetical protein
VFPATDIPGKYLGVTKFCHTFLIPIIKIAGIDEKVPNQNQKILKLFYNSGVNFS